MSGVTLKGVEKRYGSVEVVHGVDITVEQGEFCVFVGPSGCGKSTLLRMIAGLEEISGGEIRIGDARANEVHPSKRGVAMVFQTYALYPHMTVEQNLGFGLRMNGRDRKDVGRRVADAARILRIGDLMQRKPKALSGGQRQRVAIGRAIVRDPQVFLFDEPLSNLDAELRAATRLEIAKLHRELDGPTMIYVTHDQIEAMTLADKIVVLRDGRVEQVGAPLELYHHPVNQFVAGFIGSPKMNFFDVSVRVSAGRASCVLPGDMEVPLRVGDGGDPRTVGILGVRASDLTLSESMTPHITGEVTVIERLGDNDFVFFRIGDGDEKVARIADGRRLEVGQNVAFDITGRAHFFSQSGTALAELVLDGPVSQSQRPMDVVLK